MFKIRCSAIGKIMIESRSKSEFLSETCKSYLQEYYIEENYNRHKDLKNQYIKKGLQTEEAGLTLLQDTLDLDFIKKNEEKFENDFCTGTPDLIYKDEIYDIKSSFDIFTFPFFATECENKAYYWQMQGYMWLTGLQSAKLCYVLVDTPEVLIEQMLTKTSYDMGMAGDYTDEMREAIYAENTYADIDKSKRIKVFEIKRNDDDIARISKRVEECREFLKTIV